MNRISNDDRLAQLEMDTLGIMVCAHLLRSWSTARLAGESRKGKLSAWQTRRAIAFLMDHLESDIGLNAIAAHVGLSRYHFHRAFKRTVGASPHGFLLLRRLEKAKDLHEHGALSITDVASSVGYHDPNQLTRLFRKELHTTPTGYRRRYRR